MSKWIGILSLVLLIIPSYCWSEEQDANNIAICLLDLDTPPDKDLGYVVKAVNTAIANGLSQFPEITIYTSSSAPAKYFKEPDLLLKADKVRLLQIRRETGFDGLISGSIKENEGVLSIILHLIDFSSGRTFFTGEFHGRFGSELIGEIEREVVLYADSIMSYYVSSLTITSEPGGAEVWINGEQMGVTPVENLDVKGGQTQVQIKMGDYVPFETEIELQEGQKASIHAQLHKYSLTATSQPVGANVYIDDQFVGISPVENLKVTKQKFNVKFSMKGFTPYEKSVSLNPGESAYVHAELYDLLVDHFRKKESFWKIDAHNFSIAQTMAIQNIEEIEADAFPSSDIRYYAKLGRLSTGFGISLGTLNGSQHFSTFLDAEDGYEPVDINIVRGTVFGQFNIVDKVDWLEIYIGASAGFSAATSDQRNAPTDLDRLRKTSPTVGGEMGLNFYLSRMLKVSAIAGGYYAGEADYAIKEASYWGEAIYKKSTLEIHPFYLGIAVTFSIWPSLM